MFAPKELFSVAPKDQAQPKPRLIFSSILSLCGGFRGLGAFVCCILQSCLSLNGESSETGSVVSGDVGEDLAIEAVAGKFKTVDERRVAHAVDPARGVDADDPESAILALLLFAAGIGKFQ